EDGNFAVPDRLEDELRDSDFTLEPIIDDYSEEEFRDLARDLLETRVDVTLDLAEQEDWDVLTTVIRITDPYKHKFWREGNKQEIVEFYEDVDREVKRLVEGIRDEADEEVNLLVVSDHRFGRVDHTLVHFNRWLADEGYLELEDTTANLWKKYLPLDFLYNIATKLGLKNVRNLAPDAVVGARSGFSLDIDWSETTAIAQFVEETGLIYINRSDRFDEGSIAPDEYEDLRQEIIEGLREIEDPDTGEPVIKKIETREEVYDGPYLDQAPDILFKMADGYRGRDSIDSRFSNMAVERRYAVHTPDGIVLAHGPDMADTGDIGEKRIYDVAPTVLHLMGGGVPADMDGDVMTDLFAGDSKAAERAVQPRDELGGVDV
ncbi:MAG: alkaline phosphatase family protein, partial [Candidatus Nanohaloarchaea archaeon]